MVNVVTYPALTWVNADGLPVRFGKGNQVDAVVGKPTQFGVEQVFEAEIVWDRLPAFTADSAHGMIYGGYPSVAIPKNALIKSATLQATVAEASAASQTLNLGLVNAAGQPGTLSNTGLFSALAQSAVDTVGESNTGAGALIGTILGEDGYLWATVGTANFTTLVARLSVVYYAIPLDKNNT